MPFLCSLFESPRNLTLRLHGTPLGRVGGLSQLIGVIDEAKNDRRVQRAITSAPTPLRESAGSRAGSRRMRPDGLSSPSLPPQPQQQQQQQQHLNGGGGGGETAAAGYSVVNFDLSTKKPAQPGQDTPRLDASTVAFASAVAATPGIARKLKMDDAADPQSPQQQQQLMPRGSEAQEPQGPEEKQEAPVAAPVAASASSFADPDPSLPSASACSSPSLPKQPPIAMAYTTTNPIYEKDEVCSFDSIFPTPLSVSCPLWGPPTPSYPAFCPLWGPQPPPVLPPDPLWGPQPLPVLSPGPLWDPQPPPLGSPTPSWTVSCPLWGPRPPFAAPRAPSALPLRVISASTSPPRCLVLEPLLRWQRTLPLPWSRGGRGPLRPPGPQDRPSSASPTPRCPTTPPSETSSARGHHRSPPWKPRTGPRGSLTGITAAPS